MGDIKISSVMSGADVVEGAILIDNCEDGIQTELKTECNLISEISDSYVNVHTNVDDGNNSSPHDNESITVSNVITGSCQNVESDMTGLCSAKLVLEEDFKKEIDIDEEVLVNDNMDLQCERRDISNITSFTENLYETCSEVEKIMKNVKNDDNLENCASVLNTGHTSETLEDKEVIYKCGFCSLGDKDIQRLSLHIMSCKFKRKLPPRVKDVPRKKRPPPLIIAPKPGNPLGEGARIPISANAQYIITPQTKRNVVPKIQGAASSVSLSQIPGLPSAQLAMTPQGQLIARPGTQLLLTTKPSQPNLATGRQPTLLGVGIGTNPTHAAKNILLLPNLILNSSSAIKQSGGEPSICVQPPLVLQSSTQNNSIATGPVQGNVLLTDPKQPQVLLSPIYLTSNSVSNVTNTSTVTLVQQPNISKPSSSVNILPSNKGEKCEISKNASKSTNQASFICEICDDNLKDLVELRKHMRCLHEITIQSKALPCFNCQKCQYSFFTEQGLERHLIGSHGLVTAGMQEAADNGTDGGRCPICGWGYQSKLLDHVSSDHKVTLKPADLSYKCTLCTAFFASYKHFEKHVYSDHRSNLTKSKLRQRLENSSSAVK